MTARSRGRGKQTAQAVTFDAWSNLIPETEWTVYQSAITALREARVPVMLGGAFGLAAYTGRLRNTKDIDFFLLPADVALAAEALRKAGFRDYYSQLPYDRGWIFRSIRDGVIVDLIWGMPNRRTEVDASWFEFAPTLKLRTEPLLVIPAEELLWIKLYVFQRDRCDWPDVINLAYATAGALDWERIVERAGADVPLLSAALTVFLWLCPERGRAIPHWILELLHVAPRAATEQRLEVQRRLDLLDTRPWFAAFQSAEKPMIL